MNPWVTIIPVVVTVLIAIIGWLLTERHTRSQLIETQRGTISELQRQVDRLEITATLNDRIISELAKMKSSGGT